MMKFLIVYFSLLSSVVLGQQMSVLNTYVCHYTHADCIEGETCYPDGCVPMVKINSLQQTGSAKHSLEGGVMTVSLYMDDECAREPFSTSTSSGVNANDCKYVESQGYGMKFASSVTGGISGTLLAVITMVILFNS
eukprot:GHVR01112834.1.p1 GENE.GHVR01112834.1~~GHVR01112834.1.p1  ORF type:complete len:136 (+),score=12.33 GHVR01112834.1:53-460(+)